MPQVPIYNGPQVQEQVTPGGYQSEVDVTKTTRALATRLNAAADVAERGVQRDVETQANTADLEISSGWLKWDAENRKNYQGEKAGEYAAAAQKWWQDTATEYANKLDPFSKHLVTQTLQRRQAASLGNVTQFVETEKEKHADQTAAANVDTTIQFGVTSGDLAGAAQRVRELSAQTGARKGWTTEQVQAETLKNLSQMHITQIAKLTEQPGGAEAADKYYQANKAEIGFAQQPKVEQVIKAEVDNQFATQTAARVAAMPLSEQLAEAAKISDPARREKTITQIRSNHALVREAQVEQEKKFSDAAWQLVGQGKRVPEAILASMDGKERVQLQDHLRAVAERGPVQPKTDPKDHARLIDMMLNDPEAFKKERLAAAKLSPTDLEQMAAKQQALRSGGDKQDTMLTDDQRVNGALVGAGIDAKKQPEAAYQVRLEVDRRVRAESSAKGGKQLTGDEKQRVVDSVLLDKVFVNEWGTDPQKPLALLKPEELGKAYVTVGGKDVPLSTVPMTDRAEIIRARRSRGLPVSEQAIVETYLKAKTVKSEGNW